MYVHLNMTDRAVFFSISKITIFWPDVAIIISADCCVVVYGTINKYFLITDESTRVDFSISC